MKAALVSLACVLVAVSTTGSLASSTAAQVPDLCEALGDMLDNSVSLAEGANLCNDVPTEAGMCRVVAQFTLASDEAECLGNDPCPVVRAISFPEPGPLCGRTVENVLEAICSNGQLHGLLGSDCKPVFLKQSSFACPHRLRCDPQAGPCDLTRLYQCEPPAIPTSLGEVQAAGDILVAKIPKNCQRVPQIEEMPDQFQQYTCFEWCGWYPQVINYVVGIEAHDLDHVSSVIVGAEVHCSPGSTGIPPYGAACGGLDKCYAQWEHGLGTFGGSCSFTLFSLSRPVVDYLECTTDEDPNAL